MSQTSILTVDTPQHGTYWPVDLLRDGLHHAAGIYRGAMITRQVRRFQT